MELSAATSRRERQLVEIVLLSIDGERRRAGALAAEHITEFPDDDVALILVDRWFGEQPPP